MSSKPEYRLAQELNQHQGAVRCVDSNEQAIVSGGLDGYVVKYSLDVTKPESNCFQLEWRSIESQKTPIYSVAIDCDGGVYTGNQKGIIYKYKSPNPIGTYIGHSKTVNSLDATCKEILLSGSWDATARLWNKETMQCLRQLRDNQTYAVAVCMIIPPNVLVTGSQNKALNLYIDGKLKDSYENAHGDIIRRISLVDQGLHLFITCANSGDMKFWTITEATQTIQPILIDQFIDGYIATESQAFLFDCRACLIGQQLLVALAADDGTARLFYGEVVCTNKTVELIHFLGAESIWPHVSTVWGISLQPRHDDVPWPNVVTACGDGTVRIFTPRPELAMAPEDIEIKRNEALATLKSAAAAQASESAVDISKLPSVRDRHTIRGNKIGKTTLFRSEDGNSIEVYSWSGSEWQKVGDMVQPPPSAAGEITKATQHYAGDDFFPAGVYDYVFHVEIETKAGQQCLLPYRLGDNPMEVAERFCAREGISKHNVPDILTFLRKNTGSDNAPAMSPPPVQQQQQQPAPPVQPPALSDSLSPLETMLPVTFSKGSNWGPAINKILQIDKCQTENLQLDSQSRISLTCLQEGMEKNGFENCQLKMVDLHFMFGSDSVWRQWVPKSSLFPFFDMWRKLATHNSAADYFRRGGNGNQQVLFAIDTLTQVGLDCSEPLPLCILRWLANICVWSSTKGFFTEHVLSITRSLEDIVVASSITSETLANTPVLANTIVAMHSFVFNVSLSLNAEARITKATSASQREVLNEKIYGTAAFVNRIWERLKYPPCAALVSQTLALLKLSIQRMDFPPSKEFIWPSFEAIVGTNAPSGPMIVAARSILG